MRATRFFFSLLAISLCFALRARAQVANVGDDTSAPIPGVGHDYIKMLSETVVPSNGSASLRIGVPMPKGRGLTLPFAFAYETNPVHHLAAMGNGTAGWISDSSNVNLSSGGWSYSAPVLTWGTPNRTWTNYSATPPITYPCPFATGYVFQDPAGGRHAMGLADGDLPTCRSVPNPPFSVYAGGDPQYYASMPNLSSSGNWQPPVTVSDVRGAVYYFSQQGLPDYLEDRNGNKIVVIHTNGQPMGVFTITDTLGRNLMNSSGLGPSGTTNTLSFSGLTYQVTWKTTSANFSVSSTNYSTSGMGCQPPPAVSDSQTVVQSITIPNSKQYKFYYGDDNPDPNFKNPYGILSEIDYPTGGWVKYTYTLVQWELGDYTASGDVSPSVSCHYLYSVPLVASRQVGFGGSSQPVLVQTFNYSSNLNSGGGWNQKTVTVTTTDKTKNQSQQTIYTYSPLTIPFPPNEESTYGSGTQIPLEQSVQYFDWNGSLLRTVNKAWNQDPFDLISEQTTLENGLTSKVTYSYNYYASYQFSPYRDVLGRMLEKDQYDFAQTSPTKKTVITYETFGATPISPSGPYDKPCKIAVYDNTGNLAAETDYLYDGGTTVCGSPGTPSISNVANLTGHDETNYGASSSAHRANLIKVTNCLTVSGTCAAGSPSTTYTYDETGQTLSNKDPNGNITNYSYADNFDSNPSSNTNAYLTQITRPPTNGVSHIQKFKYAYSDGQLIQSTDENSQVTSYFYADSFRRPTETDFPDGGKTAISYNDSPFNSSTPSPSVTTTRAMTSATNVTSLLASDGLGHTVRSVLTSDPDCASGDRTDTTYDGLGRVYTASNPYCTSIDPTYGLTTFTYDALGRATQVTHPDNTTVLTTYTGRATQVQDEGNGTQRLTRISQTDALGRLLSLCEVAPGPFVGANGASTATLVGSSGTPAACGQDIAGTGFLTTYQYDTLSNLLQVNQSGIAPRTFTYDSISRLLTASNPESGTICYGTLSAGVCQGNGYDANGNLLTKTAPTPNQSGTATVATTYQYDALNRLTQKSYNDGTTPTVTNTYDAACNSTVYHNQIGRLAYAAVPSWSFCFGYDSMGRLLDKDLSMSVPAGVNYLDYAYDLLGDITSQTAGYGSATYAYNTAGRPITVTSSYSDPNNPATVFSAPHYNAFGGLTSDTLGNNETETYSYVPKLTRLQSYAAKLNATTIYNFNIGTFAPNGDILAANDTANGNWTYTYDPFNRLVGSNKNSGAAVYSYVYDRFGNRWQQNGPQSFIATFTGNNPGNPQNNNRMDGYSYDAAGNLLSDGTHSYTYDAENRLVKVDNGTTATYTYDADGNRVQKVSSTGSGGEFAGTWQFLYDQSGRMIQRYNGTLWQGNIYVGGRHLVEDGGGTNFSHSDWLGTERVRTTNTGAVCESIASLPFGDGQTTTGSCYHSSPLHFTGKERDSESGLDNFEARYMSSNMGRFMSPDPDNAGAINEDPQSWNGYTYARNNPLRYTDPDGLDYKVCVDNGNGGQNCTTYANYDAFQKAANASGATLNGNDQNGQILVNGKSIGSYQFFVGPGVEGAGVPEDNILAPVLFGGIFGGLRAGIRGIAEGLFGGGAKAVVEETTVAAAEQIVSGGTKQAVREAVESSGLSDAAKAAVKSALRRGAAGDKYTVEKLADGSVKVIREVAGKAGGRAAYEQTIDGASGLTKAVVQKAYDAGGNLVHVDPKFP